MRKSAFVALAGAVVAISLTGCSEQDVSYKRDVQPILAANCYECHAPGKPGYEASGFDATSYKALMRGGKFGALIKPGDAFTSAFNMVVEGRVNQSIRMPHGRAKLPESDLKILKDWVNQGAKDN